MKAIFLTILTVISISLCAQKKIDTSFVISGTMTGFPEGTAVKLEEANSSTVLSSSVISKSGKFTLKGRVNEPTLCWLKIDGEKEVYVYVENSSIKITGAKPLLNNKPKVTGSASHVAFSDFENTFGSLLLHLQTIVQKINNSSYGTIRDSMMLVYTSLLDTLQNNIDSYIDRNRSSHVSTFMLFVTGNYYENPSLIQQRFLRLDSAVQNAPMGVSLKNYLDYNLVGAVGTNAIDFTQPDTTGTPVSLSSFKGKYVLVDFWASWCGPCRMENPNVVSNYNKFKEKNFTVLGVSLDRPGRKDDWINAIHKDNLTWTHVSDLQFWNNAAAKLYRVQGIPFNFLVDPEGKIIARNLRGSDLESKLCEILGCN